MRIWENKAGDVYANAVSKNVAGEDVDGHVYTLTNGTVPSVGLFFQRGPVKEAGHNGITNEQLIAVLVHRLGVLNKAFPCRENSIAITHLETALLWLEKRTADREARGVEGQNRP